MELFISTPFNNAFVRLRVEPEFESEKRSNSELIVSVPECPFHEATYVSCDDSPLRPTLMGAFGILFCSDFKRLFYFVFHTVVCFAPVHHDEK